MKRMSIFFLTLVLTVVLGLTAQAQTWQIDKSHSEVGFSVKHLVISTVSGAFSEFDGTVTFDPENLESSKITGVVKVASIYTRNERRDNHLRSDDFFNAEEYPEITFESTEIKKSGDGFVAVGNLTIRDITKEIIVPFTVTGPITDQRGSARIAIEGSTTIKRLDYNIKWDSKMDDGNLVASNEVVLNLHAELIKK